MDPLTYTSFDKLQKENVLYLIDEYRRTLKNIFGKCMDVGCGPGDITRNIILPSLNPNTVMIGTDISEEMIEYANKTYSDQKRLKFEILDIETKSLPKKYISEFDYVFSFHVLHWCNDIRQAFENIYRILRPNGSMLVLFVKSNDMFDVFKIMMQDNRFTSYMQDTRNYTSPFHDSAHPRKELEELLQSIGFTVCHCSLREMSFSDKSSKDFSSGIMALFPFLEEMSCELKEEFKNKFTHEYAKRKLTNIHHDTQETIVIDLYEVMIVSAQKRVL